MNSLQTKKAYQKPGLRVIELVADEVLSFGCKVDSNGGPLGSPMGCGSDIQCAMNNLGS